MKITEQELKKMVQEAVTKKLAYLKEADKDIDKEKGEPGTEVPSVKKIVVFTKEIDDFIEETIEKARKLADKGEKMISSNLLKEPEVRIRNELLIHRVGTLRTIANGLATFFERIRRFSP